MTSFLLENVPIIPENIADQLFLWERERNRIQFIPCVIFDGFETKQDFEAVKSYATSRDSLTWHDPIYFKLAVMTKAEDVVKAFIKQNISRK